MVYGRLQISALDIPLQVSFFIIRFTRELISFISRNNFINCQIILDLEVSYLLQFSLVLLVLQQQISRFREINCGASAPDPYYPLGRQVSVIDADAYDYANLVQLRNGIDCYGFAAIETAYLNSKRMSLMETHLLSPVLKEVSFDVDFVEALTHDAAKKGRHY